MSSPVTITVLVEDSVSGPILKAEHGLALWVNTGAKHLLFDTGQSDLLTANAQKLGVDLKNINTMVLSHGHYDHCGGLADVLANDGGRIRIYTHADALLPKYQQSDSGMRYIGMPAHCLKALRRHEGLQTITAPTEIDPGVFLTGEIPRVHPEEEGQGTYYRDAEGRQMDPFSDDQTLFLRTPVGTVVVLGCTHAGVINTLDYICHLTGGQPFQVILGGMHLRSASDERIAWTMESLRRFPIEKFYPVHCTGMKAVAALWATFPGRCFPCGVGTSMNI